MDERARTSAGQHAPHAAYDNGVRMTFDVLFDIAIEHGDRIGEAVRPIGQGQPTSVSISLRPAEV